MKWSLFVITLFSFISSAQVFANCEIEFRQCVGLLTTVADCMGERSNACLETCQFKFNYSYAECLNDLCHPGNPGNQRAWGPDCRRDFKEGYKDCLREKNDCLGN